jgi:uncharacterized protein YjbI with pentapeptide repeats
VVWPPNKRLVLWAVGIVIVLLIFVSIGVLLWRVLAGYIQPETPTNKKDLVNVFVLIAAGVVGTLTAIAAVGNLIISRRNLQNAQATLQQQRYLDEQRAQDAALQSYFEQLGRLLTDYGLTNTNRPFIQQLAKSRTLTLLASLDGHRKGALVRFLQGGELISWEQPVAGLGDADLRDANLRDATLTNANFSHADLSRADLSGANLFGAHLIDADLSGAHLIDADLRDANLSGAIVTEEQLSRCKSLEGATMPDQQILKDYTAPDRPTFEEWRKSKGRGEDGENSGPS